MTFEFDGKNGVVRDKVTGKRGVITCKARILEMFLRLSQSLKSGAAVIIFETSKAAGKRLISETPDEVKSDPKLLMETYVRRFMDAGFGKIEVVEFNAEEAVATFRVWDNFFAEAGHEENTYCSYISGLVAGMYEQMVLKTPNVDETKCIGRGDPYCEWRLTPQ